MKNTLSLRLWLGSALALFACLFTWYYNLVEISRIAVQHGSLIRIERWFVALQWIVFAVPLVGIIAGFRVLFKKEGAGWLISDILIAFSIVWMFLAIFVWHI